MHIQDLINLKVKAAVLAEKLVVAVAEEFEVIEAELKEVWAKITHHETKAAAPVVVAAPVTPLPAKVKTPVVEEKPTIIAAKVDESVAAPIEKKAAEDQAPTEEK